MDSSIHVKPKERGSVAVKVNTAHRKGLIIENVEVISNDSKRSQITLTIKAYIMDIDIFLLPQ
jgi:hypothetical protein